MMKQPIPFSELHQGSAVLVSTQSICGCRSTSEVRRAHVHAELTFNKEQEVKGIVAVDCVRPIQLLHLVGASLVNVCAHHCIECTVFSVYQFPGASEIFPSSCAGSNIFISMRSTGKVYSQ